MHECCSIQEAHSAMHQLEFSPTDRNADFPGSPLASPLTASKEYAFMLTRLHRDVLHHYDGEEGCRCDSKTTRQPMSTKSFEWP